MPTLITTTLERADVPTANGRIYPKAVLEKAAAINRTLLVLLAHDDRNIRLGNLLGIVQELKVEDNQLKAQVILLDSPAGLTLTQLIERGYRPHFSMMGQGTVVNMEVQPDYIIDCIVFDPEPLYKVVFDPEPLCKDERLRRVLLAKARARCRAGNATVTTQVSPKREDKPQQT